MKDIESTLSELVRDESTFELLKLILSMKVRTPAQLSFDQRRLINATEFNKFEKLKSFVLRFNGLCELISNCVIANDILGSSDSLSSKLLEYQELFGVKQSNDTNIQLIYNALATKSINPYKKVTLTEVDKFSKSHTLDVYSHFQKMIAYLVNVYPFDLFSSGEKVQIGRTVNQPVLEKKLESLDDGSYIKFIAFKKGLLSFQGHSMVIKKTGASFSFFDPNEGETINLGPSGVCRKVNETMAQWYATHMAFIDGKKYIQSLNVESKLEETPADTEQKHANAENITRFSLTELQKISDQESMDDKDLVKAIDHLRAGVEQLMQQEERSIDPANNIHITQEVLNVDSEEQVQANLRELDDLRVRLKKASWGSRAGMRAPFIVNEALKNRVVTHVSSLDDIIVSFITSTPEELKSLLKTISLSSLIQSSYELAALFSIVNTDKVEIICDELHEKLSEIMPSSRHVGLVIRELDNIWDQDKNFIVYNAMRPWLTNLVTSVSDYSNVQLYLSPKAKVSFYEDMREKLPALTQSVNDIATILKITPELLRADYYELISGSVTEMIKSADDFITVLEYLRTEQRTTLYETMSKILPSLIKSADDFAKILKWITPEQRQALLGDMSSASMSAVIQSARNVKSAHDVGLILSVLPLEQCVNFCNELGDSLPTMVKKYPSIVENALNLLTLDKQAILREAIHATLPVLIEISGDMSVFNLGPILNLLLPEQGAVFCTAMQNMIRARLSSLYDLVIVLRWLSPSQCEMICNVFKNELIDMISTNDVRWGMLHQLLPSQMMVVLLALNGHLVQIIDTIDELSKVFSACSEAQARIVADIMIDKLPGMIKSIDDFALIMEFLTPAQTQVICNTMKDKLPRMVKSTKDIDVLKQKNLSPEQYTIICVAMGKSGQKWIAPLLEQSLSKRGNYYNSDSYKHELTELKKEEGVTQVKIGKNI